MVKIIKFSLAIVLILAVACSSTVRVPPSDYSTPGRAPVYRIRTVGGEVFSVKSYSVVDSTVVIRELSHSSSHDAEVPSVPFSIPLRDIASIDRIVVDRGKASVWLFAVGAVILTILFFSGSDIATN